MAILSSWALLSLLRAFKRATEKCYSVPIHCWVFLIDMILIWFQSIAVLDLHFQSCFIAKKSGKSSKLGRISPGFPLPQDLSLPCQVINFSAFFLAATHLQFFERFFVALKEDLSPLKKWFLRPQKHRQVTKIISETLRLVGLQSLWLRFIKRQNMIDEGNKVAKLNKLLKWSHRSFISLRDFKKFFPEGQLRFFLA